MFVGDALFWGNDRIPLLEAHLRSLTSPSGSEA
jgi:2-hydroxychromene-2-carboxylate isomerase